MKTATGNAKPYDPPRTEGERLLREATIGRSLSQIMADTGARSRALVSAWLHGERRPGMALRGKLEEAYRIPIAMWDYSARGTPPPPPAAAPLALAPSPAPVRPPEPEGPPPTALEDCLRMLTIIRRQLEAADLVPSQAVKLADSKTKLLVLRAKLERDHERTEDRIVREHPAFKRLVRLIVRTLEKHPAALKDLAAALKEREELALEAAAADND